MEPILRLWRDRGAINLCDTSEQIGAGYALTALAMDAEGRVRDSVYGLSYASGSPKRQRMLRNSLEVQERLQGA